VREGDNDDDTMIVPLNDDEKKLAFSYSFGSSRLPQEGK